MPKKRKGRRKQGRKKRKGKKMPANVLAYFKYRNAGLSKASAKAKAGL
jgi:hypothetical protein